MAKCNVNTNYFPMHWVRESYSEKGSKVLLPTELFFHSLEIVTALIVQHAFELRDHALSVNIVHAICLATNTV